MAKVETIDLMIEGGSAKADASLSQKLGPMKINIQDVLKQVNEKTNHFKGMKIPVKLKVEPETKHVDIEVGTPPTTELLKKELRIEKGSGKPDKEKIANIAIEQLIKVAQMKEDSLLEKTLKARIKSIAGSANSLGALIEGKTSTEFNKDLETGTYNRELQEQPTAVSAEKQERLQQQLVAVQEQLRKEQEKIAKLAEEQLKETAPAGAVPTAEKAEEKAEEKAAPAAGAKPVAGAKPETKAAAPEKKEAAKKK